MNHRDVRVYTWNWFSASTHWVGTPGLPPLQSCLSYVKFQRKFRSLTKDKNKIGRWASQRRPGPGNILPLRSYTSREKEIWSNIFVMHGNGYTSTIDRNVSTSAIMGMVTPLL